MCKAVFLSKLYALVMWITVFVTLVVSIIEGLGEGLLASTLALIYTLSSVETQTLGREPAQHGQFVALSIYLQAEEDRRTKVVRIRRRMVFMNTSGLRARLFQLVETACNHDDIIFDFGGVSSIDLTAIIALQDIYLEGEKRDNQLYLANVTKEAASNLQMAGLLELLGGEDWRRRTVEEVYAHAKEESRGAGPEPAPQAPAGGQWHH